MIKLYEGVSTVFAAAIVVAVAACASHPTEHYSGFLGNESVYSQLKLGKDAKGQPIMDWVSPELTSGKYHKVIIDPVVFYPAAAPTKDVDEATLTQIREYYTNELRQQIGAKIPVVNQPGPDVLRLDVAITAVSTTNAPLKAYQYVPVAFVVHAGMSAAGKSAQDAEIGTEIEVLDSQSGTRLAAVVKTGRGTEVTEMKQGSEKGMDMVTLDNVKPLLNSWAETAADFAAKNLSQ